MNTYMKKELQKAVAQYNFEDAKADKILQMALKTYDGGCPYECVDNAIDVYEGKFDFSKPLKDNEFVSNVRINGENSELFYIAGVDISDEKSFSEPYSAYVERSECDGHFVPQRLLNRLSKNRLFLWEPAYFEGKQTINKLPELVK